MVNARKRSYVWEHFSKESGGGGNCEKLPPCFLLPRPSFVVRHSAPLLLRSGLLGAPSGIRCTVSKDGVVCAKTFGPATATGSLMSHLRLVRGLLGPSSGEGVAPSGGEQAPKRLRQTTLGEFALFPNGPPVTRQESIDKVCLIWAKHALSYRLIDCPVYRQVFGRCVPEGINRRTLPGCMIDLASRLEGEMKERFEGEGATLALDTWTNNGDKWANLSAIIKVEANRKKNF